MAIPKSWQKLASQVKAPKWMVEQGTTIDNLIESGVLKVDSAGNPSAVKSAGTKYIKLLGNPSFKQAQSAKLKGQGTQREVQDLGERTLITPELLQGSILVPVSGDKTVTGHRITEMLGQKVDADVGGGPLFGMLHADDDLAWASMRDAAKAKQGNFDFAADITGNPNVVGTYVTMADKSFDFASPLSELTAQIAQSVNKMPKRVVKEFDEMIRSGHGGHKARPDWVGLQSADAVDQLSGMGDFPKEAAGAIRKSFMELAAKAQYRDYGFPDRAHIVKAISEPELHDVGKGSSGFSLFQAQPGADVVPHAVNKSYDTGIKGDWLGQLERYDIPPEVMLPDVMTHLGQKVNRAGQPFSRDEMIGSFMMNPKLYQRADQKWLDGVMSWLEQQRDIDPETAKKVLKVGAGLTAGALTATQANAGMLDTLVKAGYPESTAKKIVDGILPMDHASRMQRAAEQGKTMDIYHTGEGGILEFDPDEARAFETIDTGLWGSANAPVSTSYASGKIDDGQAGYRLLVDPEGFDQVDAKGQYWGGIFEPEHLDAQGNPAVDWTGLSPTTNNIAQQAKKRGAPGVVIDSVVDIGPNYPAMSKAIKDSGQEVSDWVDNYQAYGGRNVAIHDPSRVRSYYGAAFDPDQIDSTNILAARPAASAIGAVSALAAMTPEDATASQGHQMSARTLADPRAGADVLKLYSDAVSDLESAGSVGQNILPPRPDISLGKKGLLNQIDAAYGIMNERKQSFELYPELQGVEESTPIFDILTMLSPAALTKGFGLFGK